MRKLITPAALLLLLTTFSPGFAAGPEAGTVVVQDAWARATVGGVPTSAAYLTIEVTGEEPDRLVGAQSPAAGSVSLHAHVMEDGVARMRPVAAIEVEPGAPAVLAPGGLHLMLTGLKDRLEEGGSLPLTLVFERAGRVELEVPVRGLASRLHQGGHGQHGQGESH